ncbi:arsenical pump-driving ATPase [Ferrovum myxofaciens]|uniref:Arsenical pump-driving ATPase n=1 Tax=Ferrovum myxofaciens TaxID=416213 RepID=A0A859A776_9PROT|nr:arsenical pump-driving ATPase [Ferrovum myxofaciens]KXW57342.1 arsenical pump-driving ATPase [Ferrovum myxofaciens]QKE38054.1 MAG: arsenical pump-driving ATPase [Ferrovum myxofaciens]QWY75764.1 MAG: arsenical pump-driving ATPase [Ferrovum myxofaciens]QWY78496.1 MAG: arsenical pump-driving ATPase [Ferrovum myxofaciens]
MQFLDRPPRFLFFTGKGGVGKTSMACATALQLATEGKSILLVSTDPASNVGQVFGVSIGHHITTIPAVPNLAALEIDPLAAAQTFRERILGPVRGVLPEPVLNAIAEQLSGACTTEIAAFDEFTALLVDSAMTADYEHIVFDTAPTGHTLRLLQLPGAWSRFLETGKGDASCLGPLAGLEKQRTEYQAVVRALTDPARTRLVLVTRAQRASLREAARTSEELFSLGLSQQYLVINGLLPSPPLPCDELAAAIHQREQAALATLPDILATLPRAHVELKPFNLVGLEALRHFFTHHPEPAPSGEVELFESGDTPNNLSDLIDQISADGPGLILLMGKGGVGKTTLAAAVAVGLARKGLSVHLTTSDPAAHLTHTLEESLAHLTVSRIDPTEEKERHRQHVMDTQGAQLDAEGRALLEEDLRSPCTEEIAVFQAFSRIIGEADKRFVVMDTAPTGHTLLLLDATGAYHREVTRQGRNTGHHVTTPMMQLQNPKQTKVLLVTWAETTPVLETANLQADLRRAGIEPWAWIVNQSIAAAHPRAHLLRQRAHNELGEIHAVSTQHARRYALVPLMKHEPVGVNSLLELINQRIEGSKRDDKEPRIEPLLQQNPKSGDPLVCSM